MDAPYALAPTPPFERTCLEVDVAMRLGRRHGSVI
jgi:hypothetical protein